MASPDRICCGSISLDYFFKSVDLLAMRSELPEDLSADVMNTLYTPAGQRAQLILQDGTEVWLNAKSKLIYPARFTGEKRQVEVEGEAFFKVAKDPSRPFIVSTHDVDIKSWVPSLMSIAIRKPDMYRPVYWKVLSVYLSR